MRNTSDDIEQSVKREGSARCIPFQIFGPFETGIIRRYRDSIDFPGRNAKDIFLASAGRLHGDNIGCYVFARQFGRSFTPVYIGKTTRSFSEEVFDVDKREKYRLAARRNPCGKFVLFLLIPTCKRQVGRNSAIRELERELIHRGKLANPNLLNRKLVPRPSFRIVDIDMKGKGKPRKHVSQFKTMLHY